MAIAGVQAQDEMVSVRYGVSPFQDTLLPILGQEFGWYAEEGLDVEFVILGWQAVQEALAAGEVDVAINNITSVIATYDAFEFVYVYGFNIFDAGTALMAKPEFKSVEEFEAEGMEREDAVNAALRQMEGRTVVTTGNTDMGQAVIGSAEKVGLDPDSDFTIIDLNPDEGLAAFLAGTGDFYLGGIPQRVRATAEGYKPIVVGADLAIPPLNGIITTPDYAAENQETLLKLLHVWFRIVNFVEENTDEGAMIILDTLNSQTGSNMTVEGFKEYWQGYEHYPLNPSEIERDILSEDGYSYWKARWDYTNNFFVNVSGVISEPVPTEGVFLMEEIHAAYVEAYGDMYDDMSDDAGSDE
ncbi:MAG: ABC transporter substrate-binding protein [Anaerolineaceae bacterium]|nr:ABC transporter substrate-binding protein [Anaerolineaceae bacterium]